MLLGEQDDMRGNFQLISIKRQQNHQSDLHVVLLTANVLISSSSCCQLVEICSVVGPPLTVVTTTMSPFTFLFSKHI